MAATVDTSSTVVQPNHEPVSAADRQGFKPSELQEKQQPSDRQQTSKASVSLLAKSLNYPPPVPPSNRKSKIFRTEDYASVDTHALSVPDELLHQSTEAFVHYLCPSPLSELARLRSIYRWMTSFRLEDLIKKQLPGEREALPQSPLEQLKKIFAQTTNYAAVFTQLARWVGLRCLTIPGITKSSAYSIGDPIDSQRMQGQWNAVHVNGDWRFIDVYWTTAISAYDDSSQPWIRLNLRGSDTVAGANDGRTDDLPGQQQHQEQVFNEFFFLPDPDQFVLTHLPDEESWQLVDRNRIWTPDKFQNYLYIRERFFELDMQMLPSSKADCVIETNEGRTLVVFGLPSNRAKNYRFTYMLFCHKSQYDPAVHSLVFERYLLFRKRRDRIELDISFPVTGRFLLNIYAKDTESEQVFSQICSYVIDCKTHAINAEPLPDCPEIGWGPGLELEAVGMVPKSYTEPVIRVKNGELEMEFEASDLKVALLYVLSDDVDEWLGSRHGVLMMQQHKRSTSSLSIKLQLPKPGTYAVKLFATNLIAEGNIPNVLNYLVKYPGNADSLSWCKPFPVIHEGIIGTHYLSTVLSVTVSSTVDLQRIAKTSDGKLEVRLTHEMDDSEFLFHLNNIELKEEDLVHSCIREVLSRETKFCLNLPRSGHYALNIFVRLNSRDERIYVVQTQLIQSTQKVQEKQSDGDDDNDRSITARRNLVTSWCSSSVNVCRSGLIVNQLLVVYQTPVVLATAINDQFQIKIPPGNNPLVAELQRETTILFPQSHCVSKVVRKDCELFSFQVSQNGLYRIDFYECVAVGALIHLATYSITRRNPNEQELKKFASTAELYEDTNEAIQHNIETTAAVGVADAREDIEHRAANVVIQEENKRAVVKQKDVARKQPETVKPPEKPTKKTITEKKEDIVVKPPQTITPMEAKIDENQVQNNEQDITAEPKQQPTQLEQPKDTERSIQEPLERDTKGVQEPLERDTKENPSLNIKEEYLVVDESKSSLQEDTVVASVTEKENVIVEPERGALESVQAPSKEKAKKWTIKPIKKGEKSTDKSLSPKESEKKATKQKSSAKKSDEEERKLLESSLRVKLEESMKGTDAGSIQQVLTEIKVKKVTLDGDIMRQAAIRIECLQLADKLRTAVKVRDLTLLRQLVVEAKKRDLQSSIADDVKAAEDVISRLEMIRQLTQIIADMDRQLVAEVKSYTNPMPPVYNVIAATFVLLGEPKANMKDWKSVQHLFIQSGSDSLKHRVNSFDLQNIDISVAVSAERLFSSFNRHEVERISTGIALFYDWNVYVVEEVKSLYVQSGGKLNDVPGYREHPRDQQQQSASDQRRLSTSSHRFPFPTKSDHRLSPLPASHDQQQSRRSSASSVSSHRLVTAQRQGSDHRSLSASSAGQGTQPNRRRSLSPSPDNQKKKSATEIDQRRMSASSVRSNKPPSSEDRSLPHPHPQQQPQQPQQQQQQQGRRKSSDSRRSSASPTSPSHKAAKKI